MLDGRSGVRDGHRGLGALAVATTAAALVAFALTGLALASGMGARLGTEKSARLGETIVVNGGGRTLYRLSPETAHHLLCKSACLQFWHPVSVSSAKGRVTVARGISGKVGRIRRGSADFQVTLRGLPLYTYVGDSAKGQTNGQNIHSFGGVWKAVTARSGSSSSPPSPSPQPYPPAY